MGMGAAGVALIWLNQVASFGDFGGSTGGHL